MTRHVRCYSTCVPISLWCIAVACVLVPGVAGAEFVEFLTLSRELEATCGLRGDDGNDPSVVEAAEPGHDGEWISGLVADLHRGTSESIGIADQKSFAVSGSLAATVRAEGFASGSARSGADQGVFIDGEADGQSRFRIKFRVSRPTSYVLSGSIWSSGGHTDMGWWFDAGRAQFRTTNFGSEAVELDLEDGQVEIHREGVFRPGVFYEVEVQVDAVAWADHDHDADTAHVAYAAAGFEFDLYLQTDGVPTEGLTFGGLKGQFR